MNKLDAEKKVYELTEKLIFTKKDFKDVSAGYKERIKELEGEIKATIESVNPVATTCSGKEDPAEDENED